MLPEQRGKAFDYITEQLRKHRRYASSFKQAELTISNEQIDPKTKKRISWMQSNSLIESDARVRAGRILNKIKQMETKQ